MVLAHNDFYYRNILREPGGKLHLIDFEYAGPNFLGADVANFLGELVTDYDCAEPPFFAPRLGDWPKPAQVRELMRFYLALHSGFGQLRARLTEPGFVDVVRAHAAFEELPEAKLDAYVSLLPFWGQLANVFWFWASLYYFETPGVDFDWVQFAVYKVRLFDLFAGMSKS